MDVKAIVSVVILALVSLGVTAWLGGYATSQKTPDVKPRPNYEDDSKAPPLDDDDRRPKAVADETLFDFGVMELGDKGEHTFTIKNEGEDTLVITQGASTCKCTISDLPENEIPPGESAEVHLEWEPKEVSEAFSQSARIWTNDPDQRAFDFRVEGRVTSLFELLPGTDVNAGFVDEESGAEARLIVFSPVTEQLTEPEIVYDGDWLTFTTEKASAEGLEEYGPKIAYRINIKVPPDIPIGVHMEVFEVTFQADGKEHDVEITLRCNRRGPVTILPAPGTVYLDNIRLVNFQRFAAAKGKKQTITVLLDDPPDGEEIKITPGEVKNPNLKVSVERNTQLAVVNRQAFNLTFEIPPGAPPLDYSRTDNLKVSFQTSHPVVKEFDVALELHSY